MARLNVILHGLIVLAERDDGITAFLPRIADIHIFRAGDWLGETELRPGYYPLLGVNSGVDKFNHSKNLVLKGVSVAPGAFFSAHGAISFPKPAEIHSLRAVDIDLNADFAGDGRRNIDPGSTSMATVQVLVFESKTLMDVKLGDHPWQPPQVIGLETANLHIFAEEEVLEAGTNDHAIEAFDRTLQFFTNLDLRLINAKEVPHFDAAKDVPPVGVDALELEDLAHRRNRIARFGSALRDLSIARRAAGPGSESEELRQLLAPFGEFSPSGADVAACSFPVVSGS